LAKGGFVKIESLTKYTLADLFAWVGYYAAHNDGFYKSEELSTLRDIVKKFLADRAGT